MNEGIAYAYLLDEHGDVLYKTDVTTEVVRRAGSLQAYEKLYDTDYDMYLDIELSICDELTHWLENEFAADGLYVDMAYIEVV